MEFGRVICRSEGEPMARVRVACAAPSAHQAVERDADALEAEDGIASLRRFDHALALDVEPVGGQARWAEARSEEHTSELQSLMRISYAVFCLKKKIIYR